MVQQQPYGQKEHQRRQATQACHQLAVGPRKKRRRPKISASLSCRSGPND